MLVPLPDASHGILIAIEIRVPLAGKIKTNEKRPMNLPA